MIRRENEYSLTTCENMRGGDGEIKIEHYWGKDELLAKTRLFAKLTIQPGDSIGNHSHDNEEEVFVILQGKAEMSDNGQLVILNPGDTILTANGAAHSVKSIGDIPLEMMAVIVTY